jgi:hypothetical protein
MNSHPIDAVITWVDGSDPVHRRKRERYLGIATDDLHENGVNPHRWACSDELSYCLRSLENHAPWLRAIFIVTDAQMPDLSALSLPLRAKIEIIDHKQIFAGHHDVLPTFNSLAIESVLWRIEGLAEHFVYFNDDVFLTSPLAPEDVFVDGLPVLRGKWVDHATLGSLPGHFDDPALFHDFMQINAAYLLGQDTKRIFSSAHVAFPMRRSVFEGLFESHRAAFLANIAHRFRDLSQFQPQSLHNYACLQSRDYVMHSGQDYLHIRTGSAHDFPPDQVRAYLSRALAPNNKFLCVNDLKQVESRVPDARSWIEAAISRAASEV